MKFRRQAAAVLSTAVLMTTGCAGWAIGQKATFVPADADFMRNMIVHHAQALEMTNLVNARSRRQDINVLALRIQLSQETETELMRNWLEKRGEAVHPAGHEHHEQMPGMLSSQDIAKLRAATGAEFDRLFLELMIKHHEGALIMLEQLYNTRGAGQDPEVFQIASHIDSDQRAEIARMRRTLTSPIPPQEENETY